MFSCDSAWNGETMLDGRTQERLRVDMGEVATSHVVSAADPGISKTLEEGEYFLTWNGTDNSGQKVVQGVYYYTLKTEDFVDSKKLIIVKVDD